MKTFSKTELAKFNKDSDIIYLALNGKVYDVTTGKAFYGKDGTYNIFAGIDATFGLATMSLTIEELSRSLNEKELKAVQDWETKFEKKYPIVGEYKSIQ